ncbi:MAG: bifunctional enoyl-CoA hydratase/phosphate acetyltransferase [Gammaproteobacteria bacterium]|nr:bifunctional enoyl-CoA hydratase/phosphate acetyltransferase [Gammaproteobacteria bacterium]
MEYLENRTFDEIKVGDSASLVRTLTEKDIQVFAIMSGDINPAHVDEEYAQSDMFHKIIGHGMWSGALISTVLGTQLPGPGTIYVSQTIRFKKPVAIGDTLTVIVTAIEKKPEKKRVIFSCECHNQKEELVMEGQAEVVAPAKKIRRAKTVLPEISLRRTSSLFNPYIEKAKQLGAVRTGVIQPIHARILKAVSAAQQAELIHPILIGNKEKILQAANNAEIDISTYEIIAVEHSHQAIAKAMIMARQDEIDLLIRGAATREDLLHAMQKHDKGLMTERHMSYAAVLDIPTYKKALILTDTLVNIDPDLDTKRGITQNAIDFAQALGIETPKVAIVAGMDKVKYTMRSTVDAAALCKMAERGQIRGAILDGPLTFDNVISIDVAHAKGISSPVIGEADILVVPNLETGTILVEQLEHLAESRKTGLVLGARVPVLMSHINDLHLSTVSCALAILERNFRQQERK